MQQIQLKRIELRKKERERKAADLQKLIAASERAPLSPAAVSLAAAAQLLKSVGDKKASRLMSLGSAGGSGRAHWQAIAAAPSSVVSAAIEYFYFVYYLFLFLKITCCCIVFILK